MRWIQRCGDESRSLHLLDELAQVGGACGTLARGAHRLVDHHEAPGEHAHARRALRVHLQLLANAGGDLEFVGHELVDHLRRSRGAHDRGLLELAAEVEVVRAAAADRDADARPVDFPVFADRRVVPDHVRALDHDVRRAVGDVDRARRVDRHEGDVPAFGLHAVHHSPCRRVFDELDCGAEAAAQFARKVDGDTAQLPRGLVLCREDGIADIDCRAHFSARRELVDRGRGRHACATGREDERGTEERSAQHAQAFREVNSSAMLSS